MNLQIANEIFAGGSGSGCNPAVGRCGRPSLSLTKSQKWPEDGDVTVTIKVGGKEIGHIRFEQSKRYNRVRDVDLDSKFRGQGLGKKMYQKVIAYTKSQGKRFLYSDNTVSEAAGRVWKSLGAKRTAAGEFMLDVSK